MPPDCYFHHAHLFAADLDATLDWWRRMLDAQVAFDGELAGARNVFLRVGAGRLHFYDQPPRDAGRGGIHHLGIRTDDLDGLVARMTAEGAHFPNPVRAAPHFRYAMVEAPDGVLLELFEFDAKDLPAELAAYLGDEFDSTLSDLRPEVL